MYDLGQIGQYRPANSKWVIVKKHDVSDKRLYTRRDYPSEISAAKRLDAGAFKLWCYLSKNKPEYGFALSNKAAKKEYGIGKTQYDNAVKKLIEGQYLVEIREWDNNSWLFIEYPEKYKKEDNQEEDNQEEDNHETKQIKEWKQTTESNETKQIKEWKQTTESHETWQTDKDRPGDKRKSNNEKVSEHNNRKHQTEQIKARKHDIKELESNVRNNINNIANITNIKTASIFYKGKEITMPERTIVDDPKGFLQEYELIELMKHDENYYLLDWLSSHVDELGNNLELIAWLNRIRINR